MNINFLKIFIEFLSFNVEKSLENLKLLILCFSPGSRNAQGDLCPIKITNKTSKNINDIETHNIIHTSRQTKVQLDNYNINEDKIDIEATNYSIISTKNDIKNGEMNNKEIFRFDLSKLISELTLNKIMIELSIFLLDYILNEVLKLISQKHLNDEANKKSAKQLCNKKHQKNLLQKNFFPIDIKIQDTLRELRIIFKPLKIEWELGLSLEARPGLKFLIQRLCFLKYPANLINVSSSCFSSYLISLFRLCCLDFTINSSIASGLKFEKKETHRFTSLPKPVISTKFSSLKNKNISTISSIQNPTKIVVALQEPCDEEY
ncbi:hypothetical protein MXB_2026, partial [Myxobolus squamalis]